MIIGATKKAQSLFSAFSNMEDKEYGKQFVKANPLFSWHANYFNYNRKKVLILLNDLTYTPIILQDINAEMKKQLPELIPEAIRIAFEIAEIPSEKTEAYLKLAGDIQVTTTSNRSVMGSVNLMADELSSFKLNIHQTINIKMMTFYSDYIHMKLIKQGYGGSAEALHDALEKSLKLEEVLETEPYSIEKTWDYSKISQLDMADLSEQQWEEYKAILLRNNEKLLAAFKKYLTEGKGLGEKTVKRQIEQVDFYLNIYLAEYERGTPVSSSESPWDFLSYFYVRKNLLSSKTSLKQNGTALKKLYQFLYEAGDISKNNLLDANEYIRTGLEEGEEYLDAIFSDDDLWF